MSLLIRAVFGLIVLAAAASTVHASDDTRLNFLRAVLQETTVNEVGVRQTKAIEDLMALYAQSGTTDELKDEIVTILLVDTVDAHDWLTSMAVEAIATAVDLHRGAGPALRETIMRRLDDIATNYDSTRSRAAGQAQNLIRSGR
ncbi:MAG: hypothetical protein AAB036_08040 [Elusimicrobiota bacterium]